MKYLLAWLRDRQKLVAELRQKDALILAQGQRLDYYESFRSYKVTCEVGKPGEAAFISAMQGKWLVPKRLPK